MKKIFFILSIFIIGCSTTIPIKENKIIKQNLDNNYFQSYESNGICFLNRNKNVVSIEKNTFLININHMPFDTIEDNSLKNKIYTDYKKNYNQFLYNYFTINGFKKEDIFINDTSFLTQIYIKNVNMESLKNLNCLQLNLQKTIDKEYLIQYSLKESDDLSSDILISGGAITTLFQPIVSQSSTSYKDKIVGNSLYLSTVFFIESRNQIKQKIFIQVNDSFLNMTQDYNEKESERVYNVGKFKLNIKIN